MRPKGTGSNGRACVADGSSPYRAHEIRFPPGRDGRSGTAGRIEKTSE